MLVPGLSARNIAARAASAVDFPVPEGPVMAIIGTEGHIEIDSVWYQATSFTVYDENNTVIETYTQGPTPPSDGPIPYPSPGYQPFSPSASSSCMRCHSVAKTAQNTNGDFSFLLGNAN